MQREFSFSFLLRVEHQKHFIAETAIRFKPERYRVGEMLDALAVSKRRRVAPTKNNRADREIKFINDPGAKQRFIECPASLAEQTFHFPLFAQPGQRFDEVHFVAPANFHLVSQRLKLAEVAIRNPFADQNDDRRKAVFKNFGVSIERP